MVAAGGRQASCAFRGGAGSLDDRSRRPQKCRLRTSLGPHALDGYDLDDFAAIQIPGYEIVSFLGKGAMGTVYKARQVGIDRLVALKLIHPDVTSQRDFVPRFLREARTVAKLFHENIVIAHDLGRSGEVCYLSMELLDGENCQAALAREGRMQEPAALRIVRQVARALQHAHERGVVHRDVKPANIMVTREGVAKLCDFGLARALESGNTLTRTGVCMGTPLYMAPEQGSEGLDIRADIYSLGATFYHMLIGRPPFDGPSMMAILMKHVMEPVPPPRRERPELSEGVEAIILRALAKRPEDRYAIPEEMARDISQLLTSASPPAGKPPSAPAPPRRPSSAARRPPSRRAAPMPPSLRFSPPAPVSRWANRRMTALAGGAVFASVVAAVALAPRAFRPMPPVRAHAPEHVEHADAASGARFIAVSDGRFHFWSSHYESRLQLESCRVVVLFAGGERKAFDSVILEAEDVIALAAHVSDVPAQEAHLKAGLVCYAAYRGGRRDDWCLGTAELQLEAAAESGEERARRHLDEVKRARSETSSPNARRPPVRSEEGSSEDGTKADWPK